MLSKGRGGLGYLGEYLIPYICFMSLVNLGSMDFLVKDLHGLSKNSALLQKKRLASMSSVSNEGKVGKKEKDNA